MRSIGGCFALGIVLAAFGGTGTAAAAPNTYITMSDGVKLAARVFVPANRPAGGVPASLFYDGYDGGSGDTYVPAPTGAAGVRVSIRGTGCSGGSFNLFDRKHAQDGYEIVEWIAHQPWSNGHVGMVGHSYSSITALLVAAEAPPHLDAIGVSATLYDLYRNLVYAGGIPNFGFPVAWTYGVRQAADKQSTGSGIFAGDQQCARNVAEREVAEPADEPALNAAVGHTDGSWWASHSLYPRLSNIRAAVSLGHAWQDEQDGPRSAPIIFEKLPRDVPRQLVAANGHHNTSYEIGIGQHLAWIDRWMKPGVLDAERQRVAELAVAGDDSARAESTVRIRLENGSSQPTTITSTDFPLPGTEWRRMYLHAGGVLDTTSRPRTGGRRSIWAAPAARPGTRSPRRQAAS